MPRDKLLQTIGAVMDARYHRRHRRIAREVLRNVESFRGRIDLKQKSRCDEYAGDVLGWRGYAPWLHVYAAMAREFREGWIPDNFYGQVVKPALKGEHGDLSDLKSMTGMIFRSDAVPDTGYLVNGAFYTETYEPLTGDRITGHLFREVDRLAFKLDHSRQGRSIYFLERAAFDPDRVRSLGGNGVFQQYVRQHEFFDRIAPWSVATLRITTVLDDAGAFSSRAAYLRVGRCGDTHVSSRSHIRVPVDPATGALEAQGYLPSWHPVDAHPDTCTGFAGLTIPRYADCLTTVLGLHRKMPYARCIGWDVCVDRTERVKVLEWNGNHNDIKFSEATRGPCFAGLGWEKLRPKRKPVGDGVISRTVSAGLARRPALTPAAASPAAP
ncbi:MAG: sugar-transfer associated ATP-grasp domain-containing protein [Alphaproteobacteria bacterium]